MDDKIRCKVDPERWPIPTPPIIGSPRTDFSQLINCPEFVPRQTLGSINSGQCSLNSAGFNGKCGYNTSSVGLLQADNSTFGLNL